MNTLSKELISFRAVPDNQRIKVEAGILREEVSQKTQYKTIAMAAGSMLAWFADNTTISFEERKNIDRVLASLQDELNQTKSQRADSINELNRLITQYTR